jgi:hypothetical protein
MKLREHLVFLALLTPTVALLAAAVVSLAVPLPSLDISLDVQTLATGDYPASYAFAEQP